MSKHRLRLASHHNLLIQSRWFCSHLPLHNGKLRHYKLLVYNQRQSQRENEVMSDVTTLLHHTPYLLVLNALVDYRDNLS